MEKRKYPKNIAEALVVLVVFTSILVSTGAVSGSHLNLPSTPVMIEVFDGVASYFNTALSDVPSGYDVVNGVYPGWCVDIRTEMIRSPAKHAVFLYSGLSPPGNLASERWDLVNYVLNHKQGSALDIQEAIWYFVRMDGNYTPTSTLAWSIINDTIANGNGFVPGDGQAMAIICYPTILFPNQPDVQISIIEVTNTVIPEFPSVVLVLPLLTVSELLAIRICRSKKSTPVGRKRSHESMTV